MVPRLVMTPQVLPPPLKDLFPFLASSFAVAIARSLCEVADCLGMNDHYGRPLAKVRQLAWRLMHRASLSDGEIHWTAILTFDLDCGEDGRG